MNTLSVNFEILNRFIESCWSKQGHKDCKEQSIRRSPWYFYVIFVSNDYDFAYIGKTIDLNRRFNEHKFALEHSNDCKGLQRIYDKYQNFEFYAISNLETVYTLESVIFESALLRYFESLNYVSINGHDPIIFAMNRNSFLKHDDWCKRMSNRSKEVYKNAELRKKISNLVLKAYAERDISSKLSKLRKGKPQTENWKMPMQPHRYGNQNGLDNKSNLGRIQSDEEKQRRAMHIRFAYKYGIPRRFEQKTGIFEPWMHIGIPPVKRKPNPDSICYVWQWDTRQILFTCKLSELPEGHVEAYDDYTELTFVNSNNENSKNG